MKANVNLCSEDEGSPLYVACKNRQENIARILLEKGADVNLFSEHKGNPLYAACSNGNEGLVLLLLDKFADVNLCSDYEGSPLYAACKNGQKSIVILLLNKGADLNLKRLHESFCYVFDRDLVIDLSVKAVGSALCAACMCKTECDLIVKDLLRRTVKATFESKRAF